MKKNSSRWKFAVDRGGTFTDVVGIDPEDNFHSLKLLSSSEDYKDASIEGVRRMLGLKPDEPLTEKMVEEIRFGTTVATNALLERKGGRTALVITKGFKDLLEIGYQDRPEIFRLCIKKPPLLYNDLIEADERIDYSGEKIRDLNIDLLKEDLSMLIEKGIDSVAVVLMHSWKNPEHELACEEIIRNQGFSNIFLSHKTINLIKIVSRGQSTLVDAYLSTVLAGYLDGIRKATGNIPLSFMQSSGMLCQAEDFMGKNAILSGPAGGVVAVAEIAKENDIKGAIGFDMGGTSTDVSRFDQKFEKIYEQLLDGIRLQTEMLNIITVAAGGGSILTFDGQKMLAGPESAGSYPGPACYGFGGPLTVTDANLMTGKIIPDYFPKSFGPDRNSPLDLKITEEKFKLITEEINVAMGTEYSPRDIAAGFLRVADEKMAMAIKEISVSKGFDIRDYALICFGGAGGQHACRIASLLDIGTIIIHPLSGVMSAYGIGLSMPASKDARTVLTPFNRESWNSLDESFSSIESTLLKIDDKAEIEYRVSREIDLRPKGTETFLTIEYEAYENMAENFRTKYKRLFGFSPSEEELEIVNLRVEISSSKKFFPSYIDKTTTGNNIDLKERYQEIYYPDGFVNAPVYIRESVKPDTELIGPSIILDRNATVVIDPGYTATVDGAGIITIKRTGQTEKKEDYSSGRPDPVLLEVFNNLFMGAATEMGLALLNTAHSVNMKERLDFSCAVFDSSGGLVANAPHIPVHLGSMSDTVKALLDKKADEILVGDIYLTNNPYSGGSHLPDMTVICPVFSEQGTLIFFTAARGHHSDVGGTTPGSMPPSASHIDEEGVLFDNFLLVRNGQFREEPLIELLTGHTYPVRNVEERIADLKAQIAASRKGMIELQRVIERYGINTVLSYMKHIQDNSEYSVKIALNRFLDDGGKFSSTFEDHLDDGTVIRATIDINGGSDPPHTLKATIDFTGTGEQHRSDNLNAPASVAHSAVIYVLRSLIDLDIPLNSGCLKPVDIVIPEGSLLNPAYPSAVSSGNVETSQRVVDVLLGALGIAAASQGTMNNLLFEVEGETPYYETIAGGSGASDGCAGASGVQVHMTNTRMTDPEVLETRHPAVRLEKFSLRKGSGGKGLFRGGDGVIREIRFLKPATLSIISERRGYPPYGINGGGNGEKGENILKGADGQQRMIGHRAVLNLKKNESITIKTPGGGGYGKI